ncbi:MAG: acetate--CoA ligase family protein [Bacillota bacterium]
MHQISTASYDPIVMERFFNPSSVVVVGVSRMTGEGSFNILENLIAFGYRGRLYGVNPKATEILGVPCFPRAQDLPEVPDLAVITVPREIVPQVIRDCCEKGIRLFILVTQGLAEADERGAVLQAEFMAELRRHGARLIGPNTLGTVNVFDSFSSSFMPITRKEPLGSAIICQTGLFLATDLGPTTGLGKGVDVGNQADIGFPECLRYLGDDPRVEVVALHMEGLRPGEGREFVRVAREVTARKPVLVYKTARSVVGAEAAGSHSGSLAGSDVVYQAAFDEAGVIRLADVDDLDDSVKAFLHLPPMRGRRVAVISASGGGGIMAADACEDYGLELARFSPETMKGLRELYPSWMEPGNPLDVWPASIGKLYPPVFQTCFELVASDPNVDGILCIGGAFTLAGLDVGDFVVLAAETRRDKPIVWWLQGRKAVSIAARVEASRKCAVYPSADRAVRALARLARYHVDVKGRNEEPLLRPEGLPPAPEAAASPATSAVDPAGPAVGGGVDGAAAGFRLLESYGIPVARWATAATPEEAATAAGRLGFPVVLKAAGPPALHKTELGAVRLGLGTPEAVVEAGRDIVTRVGHLGLGGVGLLVQEYLPDGHEVIVGSRRDPHFGPTVLFGLGGIFTEVLKDVAVALAPVGPAQAGVLVRKTRGHAVLEGARGREPADLEALVDLIVRFSWLVTDHPEIAEIDLNPVKVFAAGRGCAAVDARVLPG